MMLSISAESKGPADGLESVADLSAADGISMLKAGMPPAERNWKSENWGIRTMEEAEMAGPILFKRFTGTYLDHKVQIEVWEIPVRASGEAKYITELSFKDDSLDAAAAFRGKLTGLLMDQGIDLERIYANLYMEDFEVQLFDAVMTRKIRRSPNGVAWLYITKKLRESYHMSQETASNTVGLMDKIKGSLIWLAFMPL